MTMHHYQASRELERIVEERRIPFYAIIMAAMRKADTVNMAKLTAAFPEQAKELQERYWSIGGHLITDVNVDCVMTGCPNEAVVGVQYGAETACVCQHHAEVIESQRDAAEAAGAFEEADDAAGR